MAPHQKYETAGVLWYTALIYVVMLSACSTRHELVVLLPGEDGEVGTVAIAGSQRTTILDTPRGAATINTRGRVKKDTLSEADITRTFAEALAAQPPQRSVLPSISLKRVRELSQARVPLSPPSLPRWPGARQLKCRLQGIRIALGQCRIMTVCPQSALKLSATC